MQKKVLITEPIDDICIKLLRKEKIHVDVQLNPDLFAILNGYQGLIIRSQTKVTAELLEKTNGLEIIGRAGAGVDNIDVKGATKKGIVVCNTPYANSIAVAELVFGLMLQHARSLGQYDDAVKKGEWPKGKFSGKEELYGKTLGIIGLGNIGREVAKRAEAFGMNISYADPYVACHQYRQLPLEKVFADADIITVHVPGMKETNGMITADLLFAMKKNALFINTARPTVLGTDLVKLLQERQDIRIALDVHDNEAAGKKPLAQFGERVILTPHIGATTKEAQLRAAQQTAEQMIAFFQGGRVKYAVNIVNP